MTSLLRWLGGLDGALGEAVYLATRKSCWRHFATAVSLVADEAVWTVVPFTLLLLRLALVSGVAGTEGSGAWLAGRLFGSVGTQELADTYNEAVTMICFNAGTKLLFLRERPPYASQDKHFIVNGDAYSFPSGHTFWAAFAQCRGLAYLGVASAAAPGWLLALPGTALIAWSRVAKGRHYPSDVLVGGVCGMLLAQLPAVVGAAAWMRCKLAVALLEVGELLLAVSVARFRTPGMSTGSLLLTLVFGLLPWGTEPPLGMGLSYALAVVSALCSLVQHPRVILSLAPSNTSLLSRTRAKLKHG